MSDTERTAPDPDAWEKACAEDLAAEQARHRAEHGTPPGSAAEELRKLADAVADKLGSIRTPFGEVAARHLVDQAKAAVEPVIERNPEVFDHLAAAGSELLAAYHSAVSGHERRWTAGWDDRKPDDRGPGARNADGDRPEGTGGGEHIDLD